MKLKAYEEEYNLFFGKFPDLEREFYPRHIVCPHGYVDPKYYALKGMALVLPQMAADGNRQISAVNMNLFNALLQYQMPTYFIDEQFVMACNATDPPKDYPLSSILFPMPAMLLVLPQKFVMSHIGFNCPYLAIARIPSGTPRFVHPLFKSRNLGSENEMILISCPLLLNNGNFITYAGWFPIDLNIGIVDTDDNKWVNDAEALSAFFEAMNDPEISYETLFNKKEQPDGENGDRKLLRFMQSLTLKIVMAMTANQIGFINYGTQVRKERIKRGVLVRDALWSPNFVGHGYKMKSEYTPGDGTHASPRMHWRRGHWHQVVHGKGRLLRRLDWFEPVIVNAK